MFAFILLEIFHQLQYEDNRSAHDNDSLFQLNNTERFLMLWMALHHGQTTFELKISLIIKTWISLSYLINCILSFAGKRCEYLVTVQVVAENSYVKLDPLYTASSLNITLIIKTKQESGVLLYTGHREHLAVELFRGRLRVSLDVGNYPASTIFR